MRAGLRSIDKSGFTGAVGGLLMLHAAMYEAHHAAGERAPGVRAAR
jgi:hypothetical protein